MGDGEFSSNDTKKGALFFEKKRVLLVLLFNDLSLDATTLKSRVC